jgi:TonB family protein
MMWQKGTGNLVAGTVLVTLLGAGGCSPKPPPATTPPATSARPGDTAGSNLTLYFDPQGADFTVWINGFKNEVYRT